MLQKTYACMDLGSKILRLIIAQDHKGKVSIVRCHSWIVNLGQHSKNINANATNKVFLAIKKAKDIIDKYDDIRVYCVATAAMRSAQNSTSIVQKIYEEHNIVCKIIDPGTEIMLSSLGCYDMFCEGFSLFMDMGGGSTEIGLMYKKYNQLSVTKWISLPYGMFYCQKMFRSKYKLSRCVYNLFNQFKLGSRKYIKSDLNLILCRSSILGFILQYMFHQYKMPKSYFIGKAFDMSYIIQIMDDMSRMNDLELSKCYAKNSKFHIPSMMGSIMYLRRIIPLLPVRSITMGNGGVKDGMVNLVRQPSIAY